MNFSLFKQSQPNSSPSCRNTRCSPSISTATPSKGHLPAVLPEGTNPIYRERTGHDCNCCRQFIKNAGKIVAIVGDEIVSIWDIAPTGTGYDTVAKALLAAVRSRPIANDTTSTTSGRSAPTSPSSSWSTDEGVEHFFINLPASAVAWDTLPTLFGRSARPTICSPVRWPPSPMGRRHRAGVDQQNSIYRGAEHVTTVQRFKNMVERSKLFRRSRNVFVWKEVEAGDHGVILIRNSVIGTLLVDLSEGVSLERAVASFESKVAPANYKRPTALVTQIHDRVRQKKVAELGLLSALERRYANIDDIKINDILFADSKARRVIVRDAFDELAGTVKAKPNLAKIEEVTIEKFIADILPTVTTVELLVENRHAGNLVSLIAPVDPTAPGMFKWNNSFSWSYSGDMADSIKRSASSKAGGNVTGELCCRLAWDYTDDPGLPTCLNRTATCSTCNKSTVNGGQLDVDANCNTSRLSEHPVENIFYKTTSKMTHGEYTSLWKLLPQVRWTGLRGGD